MQEGPHSAERDRALAQAFEAATRFAAQTARVDHAVRLAAMRGRLPRPDAPGQRVAELRAVLQRARDNGLRGMEATAQAWLAHALLAAGEPVAAAEAIDAALALRDDGHVVDQMPGLELDALAAEALAGIDPVRAGRLVATALAWLERTADTEVPEEARHAFLHLHPVHRRLRQLGAQLQAAQAGGARDKALGGQSRP